MCWHDEMNWYVMRYVFCVCFSGWLFWPGSSKWCVVEAQW